MTNKLKDMLSGSDDRVKKGLYTLLSHIDSEPKGQYENKFQKYVLRLKEAASSYKKSVAEHFHNARFYIASASSLSIGIANWSKDFAVNSTVITPLLNHDYAYSGVEWYLLAMGQEAATMGLLVSTAKNKKTVGKLALLYEGASFANFSLYKLETMGALPISTYGMIWNSLFFFFQIPLYFAILRYYIGSDKKDTKPSKENI